MQILAIAVLMVIATTTQAGLLPGPAAISPFGAAYAAPAYTAHSYAVPAAYSSPIYAAPAILKTPIKVAPAAIDYVVSVVSIILEIFDCI